MKSEELIKKIIAKRGEIEEQLGKRYVQDEPRQILDKNKFFESRGFERKRAYLLKDGNKIKIYYKGGLEKALSIETHEDFEKIERETSIKWDITTLEDMYKRMDEFGKQFGCQQ